METKETKRNNKMEYVKRKHTRFNVGDVVEFTHQFKDFGGRFEVQCGARAKVKKAYLTGGYVLESDSGIEMKFDTDWVDEHCKLHISSCDVNEYEISSSHKFDIGDTILFKSTPDRDPIDEPSALMGKVGKIINIVHCVNGQIHYRIKFNPLGLEYSFPNEKLERLCVKLPDPKFKIGDIIVCKKEFHTWNSEITVGYTVEVVDIIDGDYVVRSLRREYGKNVPEYRSRFDKCEKFFKKLEF